MTEELKERLSYLRGFTEGIDLGEETKEQKVLHKIIALLEDMAVEIDQLREDHEDLFEYTEAIDDDLTELEDDFYEDDFEDDDFEDDDFEDGFSVECPNCREIVVVGDDILDAETSIEVACPGCGEKVLVDDEEWDEDMEGLLEDSEEEDK